MDIITLLHRTNEALMEGTQAPLEAYLYLKKVKELTESIMEGCKQEAIRELQGKGGKFEDEQIVVEVRNSAGRWDFKNNDEWRLLKSKLQVVEEQCKMAYKCWEKGNSLIDETTGEIVQAASYKSGEETLFVSKNIK